MLSHPHRVAYNNEQQHVLHIVMLWIACCMLLIPQLAPHDMKIMRTSPGVDGEGATILRRLASRNLCLTRGNEGAYRPPLDSRPYFPTEIEAAGGRSIYGDLPMHGNRVEYNPPSHIRATNWLEEAKDGHHSTGYGDETVRERTGNEGLSLAANLLLTFSHGHPAHMNELHGDIAAPDQGEVKAAGAEAQLEDSGTSPAASSAARSAPKGGDIFNKADDKIACKCEIGETVCRCKVGDKTEPAHFMIAHGVVGPYGNVNKPDGTTKSVQ
jgi:hypothetical protein